MRLVVVLYRAAMGCPSLARKRERSVASRIASASAEVR
jgi:hypothetical protein